MRKYTLFLAAVTLSSIWHFCGCATVPKATPQVVKMTCKLPVFSPLYETKEFQEKGGIQISLAPVSYECQKSNVERIVDTVPTFQEQLQGAIRVGNERPKERFVEKSITPIFKVIPDRLRFRITVNNKLPRVFRGSGVVVQINIGGKLISINQKDYADLSNLIIPPRTEQQIDVYGPSLNGLPDQTTIGVFLYDIVTKTDQAGNILEKQNFEWYFNYAIQVHEETGTVQVMRGWL